MAGYHNLPHWVSSGHGQVPPGAVQGGHDGGQLYVARAHHAGEIIPGKLQPSHGTCYVSHAGGEHGHRQYEVLCNTGQCQLQWVPASHGQRPTGAIQGGKSQNGEPLFIGRVNHAGTLTCGKIHPSHGCIYIPYGGEEHSHQNYEVLVCSTVSF